MDAAGKSSDKNLVSMHLLRFFAAFSVYWYHQHIGWLIDKYLHVSFMESTEVIGATFAVPLFFLISGYCIHNAHTRSLARKEPLDLRTYARRRFWRIYPPYVVALLFSVTIIAVVQPPQSVSIADFAAHLLLLHVYHEPFLASINVTLWTIAVEAALYIVYPVFYAVARRTSIHHALGMSAAVTAISIVCFQLFGGRVSAAQSYFFTNVWFGWCFGAWLCQKQADDPSFFAKPAWRWISAGIIIVFSVLLNVDWQNDRILKYIFAIIVWAPLVMALIHHESFFRRQERWLRIPIAIGISGYSLYLLHVPLIYFKNYLIHLMSPGPLQTLVLVISVAGVPLVCYVNYLLFERPFFSLRKAGKAYGK